MKRTFVNLAALILPLLSLGQTSVHQNVFHAFIFANTNDPKIGQACREDLTNMEQQARVISSAISYKLDQRSFDGSNFDTSSLYKLLTDKAINDSDIILLYFSTHGGRTITDSGQFPNIKFPGMCPVLVNSESIHRKFKNKLHPRLLITLIDACDSLTALNNNQIVVFKDSYEHEFPLVFAHNQVDYYRTMFLKSYGDVIVTSSQKGATSLCTGTGSVFTNEFIHMNEQLSHDYGGMETMSPSWDYLLTRVSYSSKAESMVLSYKRGDTNARYPVWRNSTILEGPIPFHSIDDYIIYCDKVISETSAGTTFGNGGFYKVYIGIRKENSPPEASNPYLKLVKFYIQNRKNDIIDTLIGNKQNNFQVTYNTKDNFLVYAEVVFLNGEKMEIYTLE